MCGGPPFGPVPPLALWSGNSRPPRGQGSYRHGLADNSGRLFISRRHVTKVRTMDLLTKFHIVPPLKQVADRAETCLADLRALSTQQPFSILIRPEVLDEAYAIHADLREVSHSVSEELDAAYSATQEIFTCRDKIFRSSKAYRQHVTTKHPQPKQPLRKFDRLLHSQAGLPICRMCGKGFAAWYNLQQHVENRVCHWRTAPSSDAAPSTVPDMPAWQPAGVRQPPPRPEHSCLSFTAPSQLTAIASSLQALSPLLLSQCMQHSQSQGL